MKTPGHMPAARPEMPKGTPFYLLKCAICFGVAMIVGSEISIDRGRLIFLSQLTCTFPLGLLPGANFGAEKRP